MRRRRDPAALGALLYGLGAYRGWLVQDLAGVYFPERVASLGAFRRFAVWAAPLGGLVEWLVLLSTVMGRCVVWRGIRYRLLPRGRIEIERPKAEAFRRNRQRAADRVTSVPSPHCSNPESLIPNP